MISVDLCPLEKMPYRYQVEGMAQMIVRQHNLLADSPGLGKTIQVILLRNALMLRKILIICPASVKLNWKRELENWLTSDLSIQIINKKTDIIEPFSEVIIVNYDLITHSFLFEQLKQIQFDLGVCDEAHYLKNMKARRTHAVLAKNGLIHNCGRTIMVTGTPILNRPIELYPILKVLSPETIKPYNDYYRFAHRFCDAWMDGFALNVKGASHIEDLNQRLRQRYMVRRTVEEVMDELPKVRYQLFFVQTNKDTKLILEAIDNATKKDFKYQKFDAAAGELALLRRETAEKKFLAVSEYIIDQVVQLEKVVIFAYHHSVIDKLMNVLAKFNPVKLDGSMNSSQRQAAIDKFKDCFNCKVFVGQIQAAGQGIDGLQTVCNNVLFLEWSWVPGEIEQAVRRLARIGQTKPVLAQFLVWADSVEEHMMRVALDKVKVIKEVLK